MCAPQVRLSSRRVGRRDVGRSAVSSPQAIRLGVVEALEDGGVVAVEVVPGPGQEGVGLAVCAGQQHRVDAEPGGEGDRAFDLVPLLPTSATAALRPIIAMIPLSLYANGSGSSPRSSRRMLSAAHRPDCWATDPSCGRFRPSAPPGAVRGVSDRVDPWLPSTVRSGLESNRPPRPVAGPHSAPPRSRLPAAPDHGLGVDPVAVVELELVGVDRRDAGAEPEFDAAVAERLAAYSCDFSEKAPRTALPRSTRVTGRGARGVDAGQRCHELTDGPRGLYAGRTASDDDDVQDVLVRARSVSSRSCRCRRSRSASLTE